MVSPLKSTCCERPTTPSCGENATRHQRATTPRKSDRVVASPLKKTVCSELWSDKTVACPLWYRRMHSSRILKAIQQRCLQQSALKSGRAEIRTVLGRPGPKRAPRASAAIRCNTLPPCQLCNERIWHDNALQEPIRKVSCKADVLVKTTDMHLSRAANQQPAAKNLQA